MGINSRLERNNWKLLDNFSLERISYVPGRFAWIASSTSSEIFKNLEEKARVTGSTRGRASQAALPERVTAESIAEVGLRIIVSQFSN